MPPREFTSMTKYRKNRPDGPDLSVHESARVKKVLRTGAAVILVILAGCAVWFLAHNFTELYTIFTSDDPAAAMDAFLDGNRFLGVLIVFCIQVVQVLLAFIPGGPMQMVSGALYGGFFGGLILLALGVIGEYMGKLYLESKHRPRFLIRQVLEDDGDEKTV